MYVKSVCFVIYKNKLENVHVMLEQVASVLYTII